MALFFGQLYLAGNFEMGKSSILFMSPLGVTVLAIILAGIHTYRNDGILTSIAVAVIIMNGYTLYGVISLNNPQPDYRLFNQCGDSDYVWCTNWDYNIHYCVCVTAICPKPITCSI